MSNLTNEQSKSFTDNIFGLHEKITKLAVSMAGCEAQDYYDSIFELGDDDRRQATGEFSGELEV